MSTLTYTNRQVGAAVRRDQGRDHRHRDRLHARKLRRSRQSCRLQAAKAAQLAGKPADPTLFGPNAPKVKGGFDFVGDAYDPTSPNPANHVPHPGPNPLDCNRHGSHVSGPAVGFGVTSAGATYTGPCDSTTHNTSFTIGPGVAPRADLYTLRVFGCTGPTQVVVEAIDWAVAHDMQVINMSLGSSYGTADDPSAEASRNAAEGASSSSPRPATAATALR